MLSNSTHASRFELRQRIGEGGAGIVYAAFDEKRRVEVALKALRASDADAMYRLKREFRALANLEHPNLVRLLDLFADETGCFLTMELVRGTTLAEWAKGLPPLAASTATPEEASAAFALRLDEMRPIVAGLCRGLATLHGAGLLHRDLKPSNVMVDENGRVVLLDFGLVADAHAAVQHTMPGTVVGTVAYMAPEQGRGETELTWSVDRFALGAILYELLTGVLPWTGTMLAILADKASLDPKAPRDLVPAIPDEIDSLVRALLSRDPMARPTLDVIERVLRLDSTAPTHTTSGRSREGSHVVVGRDREMAVVDAALDRAAEGAAQIVLVRGRSGIGKTALIGASLRAAERSRGAVVLSSRCYEFETVPYKGLDGVVDSLSRFLASLPPNELGNADRLGPRATLARRADAAADPGSRSRLPARDSPPNRDAARTRRRDR